MRHFPAEICKPPLGNVPENYIAVLEAHRRRILVLSPTPVHSDSETCKHISASGSRLGGPALISPQYPWPADSNGVPMLHLAQLNLNTLPKLPKESSFPQSGLLQFFIADAPNQSCHVRLLPTAEIPEGHLEWSSANTVQLFENGFFTLQGRLCDQPPNYTDSNFELIKMPFEQTRPTRRKLERIHARQLGGIFFGPGWGSFLQGDPRTPGSDQQMFFQIDSIEKTDGVSLMLGDTGIGHFFISARDLKLGNFSNVTLHAESC